MRSRTLLRNTSSCFCQVVLDLKRSQCDPIDLPLVYSMCQLAEANADFTAQKAQPAESSFLALLL